MAAIVRMFAANLLVFRPPAGEAMAALGRVRQAGLLLLIGAAVGIALLIWFSRHAEKVNARLDGWVGNGRGIVRRAARLLIGLLDQLARSLGVLTDARALVVTVGLTALLWMSIALASLSVMRAFGLDFNLSTAIFVLGWSLVGSLVPTPGGAAGTFHAATAAGLLFLGVGQTQAAAISIVLHLVMFGTALLFGLYYFLRSDVSLASLRRLAANEARRDEGDESSDEAPPDAASYREAGALSPNELPSSGEDNNEMSVLRLSRR